MTTAGRTTAGRTTAGMTRGAPWLAAAVLVAAGGCVMDSLVADEESEIRLVRREIDGLEARLQSLRRAIGGLEAKAGPEAAAERRMDFQRDLKRAGLRVTARGPELVVTLASTVLFGPGEATIREGAGGPLLAVARAVARRFPERMVRVEGHTDSSRPRRVAERYPTNWELSASRALAVVRFLVSEGGLPREHVFAAAFGQYRPVSDNATPEGREQNRRVDVVILPPVGFEKITIAELGQ